MYEQELLEKIESLSKKLSLLAQDVENLAKENKELKELVKQIYTHKVRQRYGG